ncbi:unnamed protein product [Vicia faba]|uniref:Uncharacterized protein n=1 Tax=Vicia faba TaxID=3906 RepID=A0AAV1A135_VICFA|nr:unnamed protein product [Vicia faba]
MLQSGFGIIIRLQSGYGITRISSHYANEGIRMNQVAMDKEMHKSQIFTNVEPSLPRILITHSLRITTAPARFVGNGLRMVELSWKIAVTETSLKHHLASKESSNFSLLLSPSFFNSLKNHRTNSHLLFAFLLQPSIILHSLKKNRRKIPRNTLYAITTSSLLSSSSQTFSPPLIFILIVLHLEESPEIRKLNSEFSQKLHNYHILLHRFFIIFYNFLTVLQASSLQFPVTNIVKHLLYNNNFTSSIFLTANKQQQQHHCAAATSNNDAKTRKRRGEKERS